MAKAERKAANDIDDDPMFDTSTAAKKRAKDRRDQRLILLLERIERLREEKKGIADDEKDVFAEGKAVGYDAKLMRAMLNLRKMNPDDRNEMDSLMTIYREACGLD